MLNKIVVTNMKNNLQPAVNVELKDYLSVLKTKKNIEREVKGYL